MHDLSTTAIGCRLKKCRLAAGVLLFFLLGQNVLAAEPPIPPKPTRHFNDYAKVVPPEKGTLINAKLEQFERDTSNQLVVAVFSKLPEGTYLEEYAIKTAEAWGVGGKQQDNGLVLFVFVADRKLRIEVGYGLEGVVPDTIAASIIRNVITPYFRQGDYASGLDKGVDAIMQATRNEYKGTGRTLADRNRNEVGSPLASVIPILLLIVLYIIIKSRISSGSRSRRHPWYQGGGFYPGSGGHWGGGSGGFGGGGGFSGGGGSFGGGGASGDW